MPKSVLITGCSEGGIGSALTLAFLASGLHVYATARSRSKISHLESLPNVTLLELDVTSASSIADAVEAVRKESGGIDILVNNAGQALVMPVLDSRVDQVRGIFDVNVFGVVAVTQAFVGMLVERNGRIVNLCSIAGIVHAPWMSMYNASKAALMSYSETLRLELEPLGVTVMSVVAGAVETNIMPGNLDLPPDSRYRKAEQEIRRRATGEDVNSKALPADFARRVVGDVLGGAAGPVYRGAMASVVRFGGTFLPVWIQVCDTAGRRDLARHWG